MSQKYFRNNVYVVSSSHPCDDDMIYFRYAKTIASFGYHVTVIGCEPNSVLDQRMSYFILPKADNRFERLIRNVIIIGRYCLREMRRGDYLFFFTIDLLPLVPILYLKQIKIVQVFVENYYLKINNKAWIPTGLRGFLANAVLRLQTVVGHLCYLNIFVDRFTLNMFRDIRSRKILLPNYPINDSQMSVRMRSFDLPLQVIYAGSIGDDRGLSFMLFLAETFKTEMKIHLYGRIASESDMSRVLDNKYITYHGALPYDEVLAEEKRYDIGMAFYEDSMAFSYIGENTTKIFEYMKAGLPIIASYTKNLSRIIEIETESGICVSTTDASDAVAKIGSLIRNRNRLINYSMNGWKAFMLDRNWNAVIRESQLESLLRRNSYQ